MQAYGRRLCNRLVLVWLLCVPGWALAAPQLVEQVNAEQLAFVLRALGYERSRIDGDGDLLVAPTSACRRPTSGIGSNRMHACTSTNPATRCWVRNWT